MSEKTKPMFKQGDKIIGDFVTGHNFVGIYQGEVDFLGDRAIKLKYNTHRYYSEAVIPKAQIKNMAKISDRVYEYYDFQISSERKEFTDERESEFHNRELRENLEDKGITIPLTDQKFTGSVS